jgi:hypothetical protein
MKTTIIILSLVTLASCSSVPKTGHDETDAVISHMSKPKAVIGKDFEEKFKRDGFIGGEYIAIGSVVNNVNYHEGNMRIMAEADATSKLLTSAPTEFKKIVQRAISSLDGSNGSVEQNHISVTEVRALTGLKTQFDDVQCVNTAAPNTDLKYDFLKECRVIMRVPASNLMKAYNYTLDKKYGIQEQSAINDMLKQQLFEKVLDKPAPQINSIQAPVVKQPEQQVNPVAKAYTKE